ncbi:MAG: pseudouridine-5-phosphate glycosidase [Anaerolineae bacterium]|jgi:pseudouridine-5'-phosphate glycosidase|nr:MAG: pseudouridine-5-phosphate glycosidase [Anaerolineae bacterium]
MSRTLPPYFRLSPSLSKALNENQAVVALETTVITHGLPYPQNLQLAQEIEEEIHNAGCIPATIGIIDGKIVCGLTVDEIHALATRAQVSKVSLRDIAPLVVEKGWGGTTVAATMWVAHQVGIRVFSTGGIGGVHRYTETLRHSDVSADIQALAEIPVIVVCSGAKAILDLAATLEALETRSVPVVGYQTEVFPAFYSLGSPNLEVSVVVNTPQDIASLARTHWELGFQSAILVAAPPPQADALSADEVEAYIQQAVSEAEKQGIHGQAVTPFLLQRLYELSGGKSVQTNLSLLKNNARIAAQIALAWSKGR